MFPISQFLNPVLRQEGFLPSSERLETLRQGGGVSGIPRPGRAEQRLDSHCQAALPLPGPAGTGGFRAGSVGSFCVLHSKHLPLRPFV